jgi:hypothetical protein
MNGLLLPVQVENITTRKDRTIKITIGTQELAPAAAGDLFQYLNKIAVCYLSPENISQEEIDKVDQIQPEFEGKSQSQRIRNVLYKLWEQSNEGFNDFNSYYHSKTEKYIAHLKNKLQPF